jgi:hypothetical protein
MRVGTVCYATDQGLGMLAKDFYEAGIITDVLIWKHPSYLNHPEWYPPGTPVLNSRPFRGSAVNEFLKNVDVVLFFETPFDWDFLRVCRERNVRTAIMPMYEWYLRNPPEKPDKFLCPSLLDVNYFPGSPFLTVPADSSTWRLRTRAQRFLHNAGHIGHRNHKGTEELIKAIPLLRPEIKLTIRCQSDRIHSLLKGRDFSNVEIFTGDCPRKDLFKDYDVYVAPEKFNGLSLPLQEAYASGMMVMGSDRFPMNTWLPEAALIPVSSYHRANIGGHNFFDEAEVNPAVIAGHMNEWYDRDISTFSLYGKKWAEEHSWEVMKPKFLEELSR